MAVNARGEMISIANARPRHTSAARRPGRERLPGGQAAGTLHDQQQRAGQRARQIGKRASGLRRQAGGRGRFRAGGRRDRRGVRRRRQPDQARRRCLRDFAGVRAGVHEPTPGESRQRHIWKGETGPMRPVAGRRSSTSTVSAASAPAPTIAVSDRLTGAAPGRPATIRAAKSTGGAPVAAPACSPQRATRLARPHAAAEGSAAVTARSSRCPPSPDAELDSPSPSRRRSGRRRFDTEHVAAGRQRLRVDRGGVAVAALCAL